MYISDDYSNYKYLVHADSNYLILTTSHYAFGSSGDPYSIPVIYQYLQPSDLVIESSLPITEYQSYNDISSIYSDSIYDRADFPIMFVCSFIIFVIFGFVLNQLTKLVYKGGLFGSN